MGVQIKHEWGDRMLEENVCVQCGNYLIRWDITSKCNLKCKHCINGERYKDILEMTYRQKLEAIDKMKRFGVKRIHLLGGEATTVENICDIVEYAFDKGLALA